MRLREEIMINLFGQNIVKYKVLADEFNALSEEKKREFLNGLLFLILQSKPIPDDIEQAVNISSLKPTFTPCVLLYKGLSQFNLKKIVELPKNEQGRVLKLLVSLFKISYRRRFELEKDDPNKWWYWDFSKEENLLKLRNLFSDLTEIDWDAILGTA